MAQAAAMGPPLSPRETRRSGRRSAPSASTSTSKSPDSDQPPRQKDTALRPSLTSSNSNKGSRRLKQEDLDDAVDDRRTTSAPSVTSNGSNHGTSNGKGKRKVKDKDKQIQLDDLSGDTPGALLDENNLGLAEEEEQGITRCICGSTGEDDPDAGEFMVQCEGCKVWQHGLCMGYQTEDQVHDDDYYCEQCKPELHVDLLKRISKRPRNASANSHHNSVPSRVSRSHSPSYLLKQPSKRRNTMNSRDAAFDESLKEIIEATAAEAAAVKDTSGVDMHDESGPPHEIEGETDAQQNSKKKRKRTEDDAPVKKRTRSASTVSDRHDSVILRDETPSNGNVKVQTQVLPVAKPPARNKRGGRKAVVADVVALVESEEGVPASGTKRQGNSGRSKGSGSAKRPPLFHAVSNNSSSVNQEHGTRRSTAGGVNGQHAPSSNAEARAYRNTHAYAVSQQPLLTSWCLPDYLAHLEEMLPTNIPQPLEVRSGASAGAPGSRGESVERTMERGVKVKWPAKRMSVGDMNKRVRALVEWVGREQANALDRERRREALEKVLKEQVVSGATRNVEDDALMDLSTTSPHPDNASVAQTQASRVSSVSMLHVFNNQSSSSTMKQMEELMEELIGFQERFGPGAKTRDRERRQGNAVAVS